MQGPSLRYINFPTHIKILNEFFFFIARSYFSYYKRGLQYILLIYVININTLKSLISLSLVNQLWRSYFNAIGFKVIKTKISILQPL